MFSPLTLFRPLALIAAFAAARAAAAQDFEKEIRPLLAEYCNKCHSTEKQKGDLDLERFTSFDAVKKDPHAWELVDEQIALGEMPPKDKPQPTPEQKAQLVAWVQATLDALARERAGDPGPVVLRRLSNAEYTHTIRDLTSVAALDPAREFPVDGAAGEGFTNTGAALVMSPALLTKYLDAAKGIAEHAVLLPDGIAFSPHTSQRDWTEERLAAIRALYARFTDADGVQQVNLQGLKFDTNAGGRLPVERYTAALVEEREALIAGTRTAAQVAQARGLSAKYMATLLGELAAADDSVMLAPLRAKWRAGDAAALAATIVEWQAALWRFTTVGQIGKMNGPKAWLEARSGGALKMEGERKPDRADMDRFRALFPAALCFSKIVPVDEVVTLTLFYREDDHLRRLMLDDAQAAELDRLWAELHFISHAALKQVDVFDQLWQFATQDADPKVFEPMREPIKARAAAFRAELTAAEPRHVEAVVDFAARAWRRPLRDAEREELRALHRKLRAEELPHDAALRMTLARVFVAPAFLYKMERPAPGIAQAPVDDRELATRLSYFLWSSAPDAELAALAAAGKLRDTATLAAQTRRMLRDARVRRLAVEFGCQWLHVRDFETLDEKSERHFPTFAALRGAMAEEPVRFFTDFFQRDASVLSLLDADHTFVNAALAKHYGLDAKGDWQRVEGIRAHGRGGVLAFAATLAKQSGASRTSPILRGNWLCETLLGERLPRPPKDVPVLPDEVPQGLTDRQLTEKHSSDPKCASCHARIDPFGFAFERYDAIGGLRTTADTRARLADGTEFDGLDGVRNYLLTKRRDVFVKQFTRKLLGYALGRGVQLSDKPLLEDIAAQLSTNDYRVGVVIDMIVQSAQFREIRGRDLTAGN